MWRESEVECKNEERVECEIWRERSVKMGREWSWESGVKVGQREWIVSVGGE